MFRRKSFNYSPVQIKGLGKKNISVNRSNCTHYKYSLCNKGTLLQYTMCTLLFTTAISTLLYLNVLYRSCTTVLYSNILYVQYWKILYYFYCCTVHNDAVPHVQLAAQEQDYTVIRKQYSLYYLQTAVLCHVHGSVLYCSARYCTVLQCIVVYCTAVHGSVLSCSTR